MAEPVNRINRALIDARTRGGARAPAMKASVRQVEHAMANSWRLPGRYPMGEVGFLDSDFFKDRVAKVRRPRSASAASDRETDAAACFGRRSAKERLCAARRSGWIWRPGAT